MLQSGQDPTVTLAVIPVACVLGIIFAIILWRTVAQIQLGGSKSVLHSQNGREYLLEDEQRGDEEVCGCTVAASPRRRGGDSWPAVRRWCSRLRRFKRQSLPVQTPSLQLSISTWASSW